MSDASDRLRELGEGGVQLLPVRELLTVIGEFFVELTPVEAADATAEDLARAVLLRQALAEVTDRVGRLCPLVSPAACSCGEVFATAEDLDEHFGAVFIPADDTGLDGKQHAELARDQALFNPFPSHAAFKAFVANALLFLPWRMGREC